MLSSAANRLVPLLLLAAQAQACAPRLAWRWAPPEILVAPKASDYPDAPAVYLLKERRTLLALRWRNPSYTQWHEHDVIAVLSEKGYEYADVRVPYQQDGRFLSFAARTVGTDGVITEVQPSRVFDDKAKEGEDTSENVKIRVFSFPNVKVGSVLEYQYTIEYPNISAAFWDHTSSNIPVKKYRLEIEGTEGIVYGLKVYNTRDRIQEENTGGGWRLVWNLENIPATLDEEDRLDRRHHDPWWSFRIIQITKDRYVANWFRDWTTAMDTRADQLYFDKKELFAGWTSPLTNDAETTKCRDTACKVLAAADVVKGRLELTGFGNYGDSRPAREVFEAQSADAYERARILWRILTDSGVVAKFAFANRFGVGFFDPEVPLPHSYNHLLLWVPAQPGLERHTWIDPACDYCAPGEIPEYLAGQDALIVSAEKDILHSSPKVSTESRRIAGTVPSPGAYRRDYTLTLDESGNAKGTLVESFEGAAAQDERQELRTLSIKEQKDNVVSFLQKRAATAQIDDHGALTCDAKKKSCQRRLSFTIPSYATSAGDELIVPLTLLEMGLDDKYRKDHRELDILRNRNTRTIESLTLSVPAGWKPQALPPAASARSPGLDVSLDSRLDAEKNQVVIERRIDGRMGRYGPADYPRLQAAARTWESLRKAVLVLTR